MRVRFHWLKKIVVPMNYELMVEVRDRYLSKYVKSLFDRRLSSIFRMFDLGF